MRRRQQTRGHRRAWGRLAGLLLLLLAGCQTTPTFLPTTTFQAPTTPPTRVAATVAVATATSVPASVTPAPLTPGSKAALATARALERAPDPASTPTVTASPTPTLVPLAPLPVASRPANAALSRVADPVVLEGVDVPSLLGLDPRHVVAWRRDEAGWAQVPVQVDERTLVDLRPVMGRSDTAAPVILFYADPAVIADDDATLDGDDEIVFMARDAGLLWVEGAPPPGVIGGSAVAVVIRDPHDETAVSYLYLFAQDGSLDPAAGQAYVQYAYQPVAGDAPTESKHDETPVVGPHREASVVRTPFYGHHFAAGWVLDALHLFPGESGDLVDRFRVQLAPGNCERSEDTFSANRDRFVVNKSGPVRAIRSYVGANSGVYTQRLHLFYERRQDIVTFIRVHTVPGVMDFVDYSADALGMTYANNLNPAGVVIDGAPDEVRSGALQWELVAGSRGSLLMFHEVMTNIPELIFDSYYEDVAAPVSPPCTGDAHAYGSSGLYLHPLPCTDPARAAVDPANCPTPYDLVLNRTIYYETANVAPAHAAERYQQWQTPLQIELSQGP